MKRRDSRTMNTKRETKDGRCFVGVYLPRPVYDELARRKTIGRRSLSSEVVLTLEHGLGMGMEAAYDGQTYHH